MLINVLKINLKFTFKLFINKTIYELKSTTLRKTYKFKNQSSQTPQVNHESFQH
jgi:hypothetical protein